MIPQRLSIENLFFVFLKSNIGFKPQRVAKKILLQIADHLTIYQSLILIYCAEYHSHLWIE